MADTGEVFHGPEINNIPSPNNVHRSWFENKLIGLTMASEMKIKGQTMGFDQNILPEIGKMALVQATAKFLDWKGDISWPVAIDVAFDAYRPAFAIYVGSVATYLISGAKNSVDYFRRVKAQKVHNKRLADLSRDVSVPDIHRKK